MNGRPAQSGLVALLLLSVLGTGCETHSEETPVGAEACEHFEQGPFVDVTAAAAEGDADDISADHSAKRVGTSVLDEAGNRGGFLVFDSAEMGVTSFFLSHHFDVMAIDSDGEMIMPEKSVHEVDACAAVAMFHVFHLDVASYTLDIGPTQEESVTLVWQLGDAGDGDTGQHDHDAEE